MFKLIYLATNAKPLGQEHVTGNGDVNVVRKTSTLIFKKCGNLSFMLSFRSCGARFGLQPGHCVWQNIREGDEYIMVFSVFLVTSALKSEPRRVLSRSGRALFTSMSKALCQRLTTHYTTSRV